MATGVWGGATGPNVYDVKVTFRMGLSVAQWGFGVRNTTGSEDITAGIVSSVAPWILTNFRPLLAPTDQLVSLDVVAPETKTGASHDYGNVAGTQAADGFSRSPSFNSVVVSMKSGVRQRLGSGRFWLPVRNKGLFVGDSLTADATTTFQNFVTAFAGEYIGANPVAGFRLCNFHAALPERARTGKNAAALGPLPAVAATWYDVESLRLNTQVKPLKSRMAGVGS